MPDRFRMKLGHFVAVYLSSMLVACNTVGNNQTPVTDVKIEPIVDLSPHLPTDPAPLVAINFFASVEPDAWATYAEARQRVVNTWGVYEPIKLPADELASDTMARTIYHAIELRHAFVEKFGQQSVVLNPRTIGLDEGGTLTVRPSPLADSAMFEVWFDLNRNAIHRNSPMSVVWEGYDSMGWSIWPYFSIYSGDTSGTTGPRLLVLSHGQIGIALAENALSGARPRWKSSQGRYVPLWSYLTGNDDDGVKIKDLVDHRPVTGEKVLNLPWQAYKTTTADLRSVLETSSPTPFVPIWKYYAEIASEVYLARAPKLRHVIRHQYLNMLAPGLASRIPANKAIPEPINSLLTRFRAIESAFLTKQDEEFAQLILEGEFGRSIRQQLIAQGEFLDGLVQATNRNWTSAMLTAGLTAGIANAQGANPGLLGTQLFQIGSSAGHSSGLEGQSLRLAFDRHLNRTATATQEYVVVVADQEVTIRARSLSDLREKFQDIIDQVSSSSK